MEVITDAHITDVVQLLGPDEYQHLYVQLKLKKQDIRKAECAVNPVADEELKARRVLEKWRQQKGLSATEDILLEALRQCGYQEMVDTLTRKWTAEGM